VAGRASAAAFSPCLRKDVAAFRRAPSYRSGNAGSTSRRMLAVSFVEEVTALNKDSVVPAAAGLLRGRILELQQVLDDRADAAADRALQGLAEVQHPLHTCMRRLVPIATPEEEPVTPPPQRRRHVNVGIRYTCSGAQVVAISADTSKDDVVDVVGVGSCCLRALHPSGSRPACAALGKCVPSR
jgi:hypothetical protein